MAVSLKLNAQPRTGAGRSAVKKIKAQGFVPAVIYGGKDATQNLQLNEKEVTSLLDHASSESVLVEVNIEGAGSKTVLISEVQHNPLTKRILHVDLHAVAMDELLTAEVPIETVGEPEGVKTGGGVLEHSLRALEIECLPGDLPSAINVDVSALNVGESLHVKDIKLPKGVTALNDPELTVVAVAEPTVTAEPTPAATTAAPATAAAPAPAATEGAAS